MLYDDLVIDGDFTVINSVAMSAEGIAEHNAMLALHESMKDVVQKDFVGADGERLHAVLGASSAERWMNCAASVELGKLAPRRTTSAYAQEGTCAHTLGEMCLRLDVHPSAFEGQWISTRGDLYDQKPEEETDPENLIFEIDGDMIDAVSVYLRAIEEQYQFLRSQFPVEPIRFLEKSFNLSKLYPGMFGTNDYSFFVVGEMLTVIDYKHGRGKVVEVRNNPQLLYYALGAILEICQKTNHFPKIVRIIIVQPRAAHRDGPVRYQDLTLKEVQAFSRVLIAKAKQTKIIGQTPIAGSWCQFCNANGTTCHAVVRKAQELMLTDDSFGDLLPEEQGMSGLTTQQLVDRTVAIPGGLSKALKLAPILDAYIRGLESFAQHELENGRPILDDSGNKTHKLVRRRANRKLINGADAVVKEKIAEGVVAFEECYSIKLKSPAQLEKTKLGKRFVAGIAEQPPGGLTVADIDDKRDEVVLNPFEDLSEEDMMIPPSESALALRAPADDEWDIV